MTYPSPPAPPRPHLDDTPPTFDDQPRRPAPRRSQRARMVAVAAAVVAAVLLGAAGTYVMLRPNDTPTPPAPAAIQAPGVPIPTSTPEAAWTADAVRTFGQEATLHYEAEVRVAVLAYQQPVAKGAPKPGADGHEWAAAKVRLCVDSGALVDDADIAQRRAWVLRYADGSQVEPSSLGYRQFPAPEYPWTPPPIPAGDCLTGWITYPVPAGMRPTHVEYAYSKRVPKWAVPAA